MAEPFLSPQERDSAMWQKIKKHYESRLAQLRATNDGDLDELKTAKLRGRIDEVKLILGLDKPPPKAEKDDQRFKD